MIDPDNTFFFADPHFDHANIIKYCDRPFKNIEEMNTTILNNYKATINPDSLVFFLGDMSFGRNSRPPKHWLQQLTGKIVYIKGSHDKGIRPTNTLNCYTRFNLDTGDGIVLLIHSPHDIPLNWSGWTIHGHTHSTTMVNLGRKRVCVCVEATNYHPVSLSLIRSSIRGAMMDYDDDIWRQRNKEEATWKGNLGLTIRRV